MSKLTKARRYMAILMTSCDVRKEEAFLAAVYLYDMSAAESAALARSVEA